MLLEAGPVQRALKDGKAQAARLNVKYAQQDAANTCLDKILALIAAMELSARLLDSPQLRVLIARLATTLCPTQKRNLLAQGVVWGHIWTKQEWVSWIQPLAKVVPQGTTVILLVLFTAHPAQPANMVTSMLLPRMTAATAKTVNLGSFLAS